MQMEILVFAKFTFFCESNVLFSRHVLFSSQVKVEFGQALLLIPDALHLLHATPVACNQTNILNSRLVFRRTRVCQGHTRVSGMRPLRSTAAVNSGVTPFVGVL